MGKKGTARRARLWVGLLMFLTASGGGGAEIAAPDPSHTQAGGVTKGDAAPVTIPRKAWTKALAELGAEEFGVREEASRRFLEFLGADPGSIGWVLEQPMDLEQAQRVRAGLERFLRETPSEALTTRLDSIRRGAKSDAARELASEALDAIRPSWQTLRDRLAAALAKQADDDGDRTRKIADDLTITVMKGKVVEKHVLRMGEILYALGGEEDPDKIASLKKDRAHHLDALNEGYNAALKQMNLKIETDVADEQGRRTLRVSRGTGNEREIYRLEINGINPREASPDHRVAAHIVLRRLASIPYDQIAPTGSVLPDGSLAGPRTRPSRIYLPYGDSVVGSPMVPETGRIQHDPWSTDRHQSTAFEYLKQAFPKFGKEIEAVEPEKKLPPTT